MSFISSIQKKLQIATPDEMTRGAGPMSGIVMAQPNLNLPIPAGSHPIKAVRDGKRTVIFIMATVALLSMAGWITLLGLELFRFGRAIYNLF